MPLSSPNAENTSERAGRPVASPPKLPSSGEVVQLATDVARRLARRWGKELDRTSPDEQRMLEIDAEYERAGFLSLLSGEPMRRGDPRAQLIGAALGAMAEVDCGLAATLLSRMAAMLPWSEAEIGAALVDGWSASRLHPRYRDSLWAWGWRSSLPVTVFREGPDFYQWELVPPEGLECLVVHERMGLRACTSAEVRLISRARLDTIAADPELVQDWAESVAGWWATIALSAARAALRYAADYARTRYQGGAVLARHALIQTMFGRGMEGLYAADTLLQRGFAGDRRTLRLGIRLAIRAAEQAAHTAQQVLGGYGYMRDYPVERWLRDVKMAAIASGASAITWAHAAREEFWGDDSSP